MQTERNQVHEVVLEALQVERFYVLRKKFYVLNLLNDTLERSKNAI